MNRGIRSLFVPPVVTTSSPPIDDADAGFLAQALQLAAGAIGLSDPNPRVGCVVVDRAGQVIGRGHTQAAGGPHAEIVALADARRSGGALQGSTAYVTLEPCAHHGRTPPCSAALIEAGVGRVVVLGGDPNPLVAGRGLAQLRAAGVRTEVAGADAPEVVRQLVLAARELNIGFLSRMERGRPWVRMKIAASLDGRTALDNGASQWITGEAARRDGHAFRKRAGAVLTGVGTVLEDDPRLDVRLVDTARQPLRAVVDSRLDTPEGARLLAQPQGLLFYVAVPAASRADRYRALGAEIVRLPGPNGKVDLAAMLADLAARGINELHVEAGHRLNGSLLCADLVDELLLYLAPTLLGAGREMAAYGPLTSLADGLAFEWRQAEPVGNDLRLVARRRRPGP